FVGSIDPLARNSRVVSGGILPPGRHVAEHLTGQNERVLTDDQWGMFKLLVSILAPRHGTAGQPGRSDVENLTVKSNRPPREWIEEGAWHLAHGVLRSEWEDA